MILLDKPLVSDFLLNTIRAGRIQALDTGHVLQGREAPLLQEEEAIRILAGDPLINLHTTSENALKWIYARLPASGLAEKISLFKNKTSFRKLTSDMYPDFFFREVRGDRLNEIDIRELPVPFIIKPATGFFSMGVHKVMDEAGWERTKEKIGREMEQMRSVYPAEVLSLDKYIIEECVRGHEYAFDAYYDDDGRPVLMGAMHHPFSGEGDVSDRVYNTGRDIIMGHAQDYLAFLRELGRCAGLRNFSLHVEVRIDENASLVPIEVNPLRFGAWCTSADLTHYAFGFNPYDFYINKQKPDWERILAQADDSIYSIIILENSTGIEGREIRAFDYEKALSRLGEVMEMRKIDFHHYPIFGIFFTRTKPEDYGRIEEMLHADMQEFITTR